MLRDFNMKIKLIRSGNLSMHQKYNKYLFFKHIIKKERRSCLFLEIIFKIVMFFRNFHIKYGVITKNPPYTSCSTNTKQDPGLRQPLFWDHLLPTPVFSLQELQSCTLWRSLGWWLIDEVELKWLGVWSFI